MELVSIPSHFGSRFENDVCSGSVSEKGRLLLGQNGGSVMWHRLKNKSFCVVRDGHLQTAFVEWFPSGVVALSGGSEGLLKVWDCEEDNEDDEEPIVAAAVLSGGHRKAVLCAAVIGRGRTLVSGGRDGLVLWEVPSQKAVRHWQEADEVLCVLTGENDCELVVCGGNKGKASVRSGLFDCSCSKKGRKGV